MFNVIMITNKIKEWNQKMDFRKIMYVIIIVVCVLSIAAGVYIQLLKQVKKTEEMNMDVLYESKSQETLKKEFFDMFDNQLHTGTYDTKTIKKNDTNQEILYTFYSLQEKTDNYDVDINFPIINIKSELASNLNEITQDIFVNKANDILFETQKNNIYTVSYTGYINGDIMSVIINAKIKEGTNPQRSIVKTYNYNLRKNQEAKIEDVLENISMDELSKKINTKIKEAIKETNELQVAGYSVYKRDIDSDMYKAENITDFYLGENGKLYIVYAYGNNEFTSEMDIIVI